MRKEDEKTNLLRMLKVVFRNKISQRWSRPTGEKVSRDVRAIPRGSVEVYRGGGDGWRVKCEGGEVCWHAMVTTHWPKLLNHYGYPDGKQVRRRRRRMHFSLELGGISRLITLVLSLTVCTR